MGWNSVPNDRQRGKLHRAEFYPPSQWMRFGARYAMCCGLRGKLCFIIVLYGRVMSHA